MNFRSPQQTSEAGGLVGKGMMYDMQVRKEELAERLSKSRKPLPLAFPLLQKYILYSKTGVASIYRTEKKHPVVISTTKVNFLPLIH